MQVGCRTGSVCCRTAPCLLARMQCATHCAVTRSVEGAGTELSSGSSGRLLWLPERCLVQMSGTRTCCDGWAAHILCLHVVCCCVLSCAALLAAFTYDVRTRQYTQLMTVQESPLGAAYRNLTALSTTTHTLSHCSGSGSTNTQQGSTSGSTAGTAATARPAAPEAASLHKQHAAAIPTRRKVAPLASSSAGHRPLRQDGHTPHRMGAAAASLPPLAAVSGEAVPSISQPADAPTAEQSTRSSPRMLGYAVPLQPIRSTESLVAAAAAGMQACSGPVGCVPSASGLQFHVSLVARFPFLVRELAASELQSAADEQPPATKPPAASTYEPAAATRCDCSSSSGVSWAAGTSEDCAVFSLPPCMQHGQPQVNSLGAYMEQHKLQQVRFWQGL